MRTPPPDAHMTEDRINKDYYDDIRRSLPERATVLHEIKAMMARGNARYVENWPGYKTKALEKKFGSNRMTHEITHLCARIPHSMQGEMSGLYFEWGLANGFGLLQLDREAANVFSKELLDSVDSYIHFSAHYHTKLPVRASKRSEAIHFAAGLYLREKMEAFVQQGLDTKSYEEQLAFCRAYADTDHQPDLANATPVSLFSHPSDLDEKGKLMDRCKHAPNALIHLDPKEWRAIEAVALGMCTPDQTPYAGRLQPVKDTLQYLGIYFDRPKFVEQLAAEKMAKERQRDIGADDSSPSR